MGIDAVKAFRLPMLAIFVQNEALSDHNPIRKASTVIHENLRAEIRHISIEVVS